MSGSTPKINGNSRYIYITSFKKNKLKLYFHSFKLLMIEHSNDDNSLAICGSYHERAV